MERSAILTKVNNLPHQPGCYLYFNDQHQVIYVGKAKDLHKRVASYFNRAHNFKTTQLVRDIVDLQTIITNSEKEALILEHNLIKQYKPRYNIMLNDDKSYPYIVVTNERDPEYRLVRNVKKEYKHTYGPFPDGSKAREILKLVERLFPLRRCKGYVGKACLFYHIQQCSGACFQTVDSGYYQEQLKLVDQFFRGQTTTVLETLTQKMRIAASNLQFEEAGRIKELMSKINWTTGDQKMELPTEQNWDVTSFDFNQRSVVITTLFYRGGKLLSQNHDEFENTDDINNMIQLYLQNLYSQNPVPEKILVDSRITLTDLRLLYSKRVNHPRNSTEEQLINLAWKNSKETLQQNEINKYAPQLKVQDVLEQLQHIAQLSRFPYHIEVFDISNLYSENVIGACTVYRNGLASRHEWRKYKINISQQDDYHRMQDMLTRRYKRMLSTTQPLPDLVIMDGGPLQVQAARNAYAALEIEIPTIGLVKDDHHRTNEILLGDGSRQILPRPSQLFNFLTKLQDEVHNYAIREFRKQHTKQQQTSILLQVPGISLKKAQLLFQEFNSLENMLSAGAANINLVVHNKTTTQKLLDFLITYLNK